MSDHPSRRGPWTPLSIALAAALLAGPVARADDEPPVREDEAEAEAREPDLLERVVALGRRIEAVVAEPEEEGFLRALERAWEGSIERLARRIEARSARIADKDLFVRDDAGRALRLDPSRWSFFVRQSSSLYTELASVLDDHVDYGVPDPERAYREWEHDNPPPDMKGLTPAGVARIRVGAQIDYYVINGLPVPPSLVAEHRRLTALEAQQIRERERRYRGWKAERERAFAAIRAEVMRTAEALETVRVEFVARLAELRQLMADLQAVEETRLEGRVAALGDDAPSRVPELLRAMRIGRRDALAFRDEAGSGWGSLLRREWLRHRNLLEGLLERAERGADDDRGGDAPPNEDDDEPGPDEDDAEGDAGDR